MAPKTPSTLRVVLLSWWVLYRVARNRMQRSAGKALSILFFPLFLGVIALQVVNQATLQRSILLLRIGNGTDGLIAAAGQAAAVFFLDVLGLLLLVPAGMIRADGIVGKQRAAVDTELWLTLPLSGRQQLAARLAQATFFISFIGLFFLSHFIGPALSFGRSTTTGVLLFLGMAGTAGLIVFGGGIALYALARRYLRPQTQGRLVTWSGLGMLPVLFASFAFTSHVHGRLTHLLATLASRTSLAAFFADIYAGHLRAAALHGAVVLLPALILSLCGYWAVEYLGREAVDDLVPLIGNHRYPTRPDEDRPLSHLAKDLRLRLRDPLHRGAFVASLISSFTILLINSLSPGPLIEALNRGVADGPAVMVVAFLCGITALLSASQWLPLEARALEFLRTSGIEPPWLVVHKGLCAMVEVLVLCVPPCATLIVIGGRRLLPPTLECLLLALGVAWFVVGDSAARFPESRRDTRPFQMRTFLSTYTLIICGGSAIVYSHSAALAALVIIAMGALGRTDAGIDALTYLDDTIDRPRRVRFADAWLAGAAAAAVQMVVAIVIITIAYRRQHGLPVIIAVMVAYSASAVVLGGWSVLYLRRRLPAADLLGQPPRRGGYLFGLGMGLLSAGLAAGYALAVRRLFPHSGMEMDLNGVPMIARLGIAVVLVGIDPVAEEVFFRGWILRGLDERLGRPWLTLILQALLFAVLHPALSYVPVGVLGLLAGLVVRRTGSVRPAVLTHAVHNALPAILLCLGRTT